MVKWYSRYHHHCRYLVPGFVSRKLKHCCNFRWNWITRILLSFILEIEHYPINNRVHLLQCHNSLAIIVNFRGSMSVSLSLSLSLCACVCARTRVNVCMCACMYMWIYCVTLLIAWSFIFQLGNVSCQDEGCPNQARPWPTLRLF